MRDCIDLISLSLHMKFFPLYAYRSFRLRKHGRRYLCVLLLFLTLCMFYMCYFKPKSLSITDNADIASLRRQGWKTVFHATTYFVSGNWQEIFDFRSCSQYQCVLTSNFVLADAVIFHMTDIFLQWWTHVPKKQQGQLWVLYGQESLTNTLWYPSPFLDGYFNWTMTHKQESDVLLSYNKGCVWTKSKTKNRKGRYLQGRTKEAYIVTSNCYTSSERMEFIREMQEYMEVDVFGSCGTPCSSHADACDFAKLASKYKFYLSFENSLCKDYITEKFFRNALNYDIVPVVRGGTSRAQYEAYVPEPNAVIYADDYSGPKALAQYLKNVSHNEDLYGRHLSWRDRFTRYCPPYEKQRVGCQLCRALHNSTLMRKSRVLNRVSDFWNRYSDCRDRVVHPNRSAWTKLVDFFVYLIHF